MTISWVDQDGKTGIAENAYEFQMQSSETKAKEPDFKGTFDQFSEAQQRNFETKLAPEEEPKFQDWKQQYAPNDSGYDYDLRGAYLRGFTPDPAQDNHWPDTFKKPWHETFSNESVYAPDAPGLAGSWSGPNHDIYTPGSERPKPIADRLLAPPDHFDWEHVPSTKYLDNNSLENSIDQNGPALIVPKTNLNHPKVQEFLRNPPSDFEIKKREDDTGLIYIRRKPGAAVASRDDEVDANQTKLADMIHDLRVKFMGDPDKWSTKEEVGNFINQAMSVMGGGFRINNKAPLPNVTIKTPTIERWAKYEEMSAQGKTTKQILKSTKLEPETVRDALGRDNLAIAAFNSENALTTAYFKSLEGLDPALQKALKNQVSVKDLKRYTRNLPEEQLKSIFEELPVSVKESFQSGEARRANIDAGKKTKIIAKPLK